MSGLRVVTAEDSPATLRELTDETLFQEARLYQETGNLMPEYRDVRDPLALAIAVRMPKSLTSGSFTIGPDLLDLADQDFGKVVNVIVDRATFIGAEFNLHFEKIVQFNSFSEGHVKAFFNTTVNWSR